MAFQWYEKVALPIASRFDPEWVHERTLRLLGASPLGALPRAVLRRACSVHDKRLVRTIWGLTFSNPFGLAAGFDKNASALPLFTALGFGHVEVGTVTPEPQSGNPRPRIVRLSSDRALINRMGFPSDGACEVARSLQEWRAHAPLGSTPIIGVNIGKQKTTSVEDAAKDYVRCFDVLSPFADYVTVNVSSPNTPELRRLQEPDRLKALFGALSAANSRGVPILVKIAPDLSEEQLQGILDVCLSSDIRGIIATNTTISREGLSTPTDEVGGLSGVPIKSRAQAIVRIISQRVANSLPIVAVGGVASGADAESYLEAGASLVQLYTGLVYQGPMLVRELNEYLLRAA